MKIAEILQAKQDAERVIRVCNRALICIEGYKQTGVMRLAVGVALGRPDIRERRLEPAERVSEDTIAGVAWSFASRLTN